MYRLHNETHLLHRNVCDWHASTPLKVGKRIRQRVIPSDCCHRILYHEEGSCLVPSHAEVDSMCHPNLFVLGNDRTKLLHLP